MATNYEAIKKENVVYYGTHIDRIGSLLLANRYDNRAHFILELLQNAEDALRRREHRNGPRAVHFSLSDDALRFSHHGKLFSEPDVRGICGIGLTTKTEELTAIGRFGIGFKAVYAFTNSPEIHSGDEHFAIDSYVWPRSIEPIPIQKEETVFRFAFRENDAVAHSEIAAGLRSLGARSLLFLREIDEITWSVTNGPSGSYLREEELISDYARRVTLVGQGLGDVSELIEERWLVFSRDIASDGGQRAGAIEVAFRLVESDFDGTVCVSPISDSTLVVFFPTIVATNLGCLIQGPYRTTPSRDNVPRDDEWNRHLIAQTGGLLVESLHKLKEMGLLTVSALQALPIDRALFPTDSMFCPIYDAVRTALKSEALLPRFRNGHVAGSHSRLARTRELRELLDSSQLSAIFSSKDELHWLHEDITRDRTAKLRNYLIDELSVFEFEPEAFYSRLSQPFLEAQSDAWIVQLYSFLSGQPALGKSDGFLKKPLVRLEDGRHVSASVAGQPQAFLPGSGETEFPTVKRSICEDPQGLEFLKQLGLTEPDRVDDVVKNVLPRYSAPSAEVAVNEYSADVGRILAAFATDSKKQRDKLVSALRTTAFICARDAADGIRRLSNPESVYRATQRLKELFGGAKGVLLVDDSLDCLRGEAVDALLEACGAPEYLQPVAAYPSSEEIEILRATAEVPSNRNLTEITDWDLRGLHSLLKLLPTLSVDESRRRSQGLWDALCTMVDRRGRSSFTGTIKWHYYSWQQHTFPAAFTQRLNDTAWILDCDGVLKAPADLVFEELNPPWKEEPFLLSKIRFKPAAISLLAKESGIEPGALDLLRKHGITTEAEVMKLLSQLGIKEQIPQPEHKPSPGSVNDALKNILGGAPAPTPPVPDPNGPDPSGSGGAGRTGGAAGQTGVGGGAGTGTGPSGKGGTGTSPTGDGPADGQPSAGSSSASKRTPGSAGGRPFISYVGTHPDDKGPDPDGLDQSARMALEEKAIQLILADEPGLQRTPTHNPGFDLFEAGADGRPTRWVEVKAMAGSLHDRPVGVSHTQFECARNHGEAYWLYVVEHACDDGSARIVRIQDPAGKARTFTFDHGWLSVAEIGDETNSEVVEQTVE